MNKAKKEDKMVGVFMPPHFLNYLGLYVLFTGQTKATPLRTAFHDWVKKTSQQLPEKKLIENIIKKYQSEWEATKSIGTESTTIEEAFICFKNRVLSELSKKGISAGICKKITQRLKQ